jgi:hypothetical protein
MLFPTIVVSAMSDRHRALLSLHYVGMSGPSKLSHYGYLTLVRVNPCVPDSHSSAA